MDPRYIERHAQGVQPQIEVSLSLAPQTYPSMVRLDEVAMIDPYLPRGIAPKSL